MGQTIGQRLATEFVDTVTHVVETYINAWDVIHTQFSPHEQLIEESLTAEQQERLAALFRRLECME